ncbi:protein kinase domain-containing protein [Archangium sp.]|uniref:protein kinase domain-containing protein n=1 Tax=Archangium sp. TaxID=1872627 RepID=UPI00389B0F4D
MPYSAPEALRGQPATALSDVFALGIVLYELLAGQHPFATGSEDPMAFAMAITEKEPPPLTDVPAPLVSVVMRAMAKAPEARFPRPEDMAEALTRYLAQAGEPASSQSLAAFIASLTPPLTLVELGEAAEQEGDMARTVRRPSLSTHAVNPTSFELQPAEEWEEQPGGRALSTSGRLIEPSAPAPAPAPPPPTPARAAPPPRARPQARCSRCNGLLPSPNAPCERCARELSPELSTLAENGAYAPPEPGAAPLRSVLDMKHEELELIERGPKQGTLYEPPKRRLQWQRPVALVATLLLLVGAGVVALPHLKILYSKALLSSGAKTTPLLSIQSEPEGALVTIDGTELGTTPLVIDNTYPEQPISVQVTLKGHKPWKGTFTGGQPTALEVKLKR